MDALKSWVAKMQAAGHRFKLGHRDRRVVIDPWLKDRADMAYFNLHREELTRLIKGELIPGVPVVAPAAKPSGPTRAVDAEARTVALEARATAENSFSFTKLVEEDLREELAEVRAEVVELRAELAEVRERLTAAG